MLRERAAGLELLVLEHAEQPEAGLQVPGGTVARAEPPLAAVAREVLEENGLAVEGWEAAATLDHEDVPGSATPGPQRWHCFATTPGMPPPDSWRFEHRGFASERGLRFEYHWIALAGGVPLAGRQEEARRAGRCLGRGAPVAARRKASIRHRTQRARGMGTKRGPPSGRPSCMRTQARSQGVRTGSCSSSSAGGSGGGSGGGALAICSAVTSPST